MEIQGYFTQKGLALSAKLLTGTALQITRVVAGSGRTAESAGGLSLPRQELAVNSPIRSGSTATISATLTAALAASDYTLTELGVYAQDPDEGEILYKIYQLETPVDITAGSQLVLRFYLKETVSPALNVAVACSPAGLVTEEDFAPVRDRVQKTALPSRTVTLAASELPAYIAALPRLLAENLTLSVSGTLTGQLTISNFYGGGRLAITAGSLGDCVIAGSVNVEMCSANVFLQNLRIVVPENAEDVDAMLLVARCPLFETSNCEFTGNDTGYGIKVSSDSHAYIGTTKVSHVRVAVLAQVCSTVSVFSENAQDYQNNTIGAYVSRGGIILLTGYAPNLLGGTTNEKSGGMVVSATGTLL